VDGLVSDGATCNSQLWWKLSVSGERDTLKNKFEPLLDGKIYIIYSLMHPILSRMPGINYNII